ncbi:MAG: hypothetical protein JSU67_10700 [Gammaproteobacteria bacterium]|nr:MAG: hypothetical protein JSU67_10700 [Gammaproteobacteria bacterium]
MSIISDVRAVYDSVRGSWVKSQAHVVSHVVLAGVIFWIGGASIPEVSVKLIDPGQLLGNQWYKLAKETGVIYFCLAFPVLVLAAYAVILQSAGQMLVSILMLLLPPSSRANRYRSLSPQILEPLALTLDSEDFNLQDIQNKSAEFMMKYQSRENEQWEKLEKSVSDLTKNSQIYLADFLVFVLVWIFLFAFLSEASWVKANDPAYWPVTTILLLLVWFAWFRVSRAISNMPALLLIFVSTMIRSDPDMESVLKVSNDKHDKIMLKLAELLKAEHTRTETGPSLLLFIRYKIGLEEEGVDSDAKKDLRGFPFPQLYWDGVSFSFNEERYKRYEGEWFAGYLAYLYYRLHKRITNLIKATWQFFKYIVTGVP